MNKYNFLFILLGFFLFLSSLLSQKAYAIVDCPAGEECSNFCVGHPNDPACTGGNASVPENMLKNYSAIPKANAAFECSGSWSVTDNNNQCGAFPAPGFFNCCINPATTQTCDGLGGVCNNPGHACTNGRVPASNSYECADTCCRPIVCSDLSLSGSSGTCAPGSGQQFCTGGRTNSYSGFAANDSCNTFTCCLPRQNCTGGQVSSGSCTPNGMAANTCGNPGGLRHSTLTTTAVCGNGFSCVTTGDCTNVPGSNTFCDPGVQDNCNDNAGYACINNNTCVTNIFVHVYTDYNHSGTNNGGGKSGVTISDNGGNTPQTDGSGNVTFSGKTTGNYTITETVLANFQATNATSQGVSLTNNAGNVTVNFYLTPLYSISGRVFKDQNKNQQYDGSDTGYGGGTIHISGGPTAVSDMVAAGDGTWSTPTNLLAGTYLVSYTTSLATGYRFTTPSSYSVTVGNPAGSIDCAVGGSLDGTCGGINSGSIAELNVGLTDENPWKQSVCLDIRDDSGAYTELIPAAPSCGGVSGAYNSVTNADCTTGAGIVFTCNASPDFGLGSANSSNWQAGGVTATDQECFSGAGLDVVRTSYDYLTTTMRESGITPINMTTVCGVGGLGNCTFVPGIDKGVYLAEGDVHLNSYTFPFDALHPQSFVFLIHGDLYIDGNILVPAGSVAAFSTSGNIIVNKEVGNVITDTSDAANNNPNLEGLYSADASFIVETKGSGTNICNPNGTPLDKKLNIVGSIITNAAKGGGSFLNNRDLCIYDLQCSSVSFGDGNNGNSGLALSYLLTLYADGKFLSHKVFNWEELRP